MVDRETEEFFNDIGSFMATTGKGSLVAAFILSYFLSFAMSQLMSAVRSLQLITFMLIMELKYPPYIIEFFHMFFKFTALNVVPTDFIQTEVFKFQEEED